MSCQDGVIEPHDSKSAYEWDRSATGGASEQPREERTLEGARYKVIAAECFPRLGIQRNAIVEVA